MWDGLDWVGGYFAGQGVASSSVISIFVANIGPRLLPFAVTICNVSFA